jgi:putative methyltransferase
MSLYYEAAAILANSDNIGGSLKSRIFNKKDLKSTPGQIFALIAESSKWSVVLKDVIEKTKLLAEERKVSLSSHVRILQQLTYISSPLSSLSSSRMTYSLPRKVSLHQPRMSSSLQ